MTFDFEYFCQQQRIDYISHGVNVKAGEINIACPFCAETSDPDPSHHCGVDSERSVFSCWRNAGHRGKRLHRLIMKLLRCGFAQAQNILGLPVWTTPPSIFKKFDDDVESLFAEEVIEIPQLEFFKDFRTFGTKFHYEKDFVTYLISRNFSKTDILKLANRYHMRWAVNGPFRQRIIFPNYYDQQLINWTARSIVPTPVRYRALSETEGAMVSIKKSIYQWDSLLDQPTRCVVITEGPLDAIKLDFYGQKYGFRATCLFSKQTTLEQQSLVIALSDVFDEVLVWLDDDAKDSAERLIAQCEGLAFLRLADVAAHVHDAGELNWQEIKQWCLQQLEILDERESQPRSRQRTNRSSKSYVPRMWLQN